jgi:hypothetical protein
MTHVVTFVKVGYILDALRARGEIQLRPFGRESQQHPLPSLRTHRAAARVDRL